MCVCVCVCVCEMAGVGLKGVFTLDLHEEEWEKREAGLRGFSHDPAPF